MDVLPEQPNVGADPERRRAAERPDEPVIGYQRWDRILFLHWRVPSTALRPVVDRRLQIDTYDGEAFVSVTPFTVAGARLKGLPAIPRLSTFHELNVRTYVVGPEGPGVWFFSLDAASGLAALTARAALRLPYRWARISRAVAGPQMTYGLTRRGGGAHAASLAARWTIGDPVPPAPAGSLEAFLLERIRLYAVWHTGDLYCLPVFHELWPLRAARLVSLEQTMLAAAGLPQIGGPLVHYSDGVDVEFFAPRRVTAASA